MSIIAYHADGEVSHATEAVSREAAGREYLPDHWHVWLATGKRITTSAEKLDTFYRGWRDLPLRAKS